MAWLGLQTGNRFNHVALLVDFAQQIQRALPQLDLVALLFLHLPGPLRPCAGKSAVVLADVVLVVERRRLRANVHPLDDLLFHQIII